MERTNKIYIRKMCNFKEKMKDDRGHGSHRKKKRSNSKTVKQFHDSEEEEQAK